MSNGMFVLALAAGAWFLALWMHMRFPSLAPERLGHTVLHSASAFVLLQLLPSLGGSETALTVIFVFVLPALVYALLCAIWMIRQAQVALGLTR